MAAMKQVDFANGNIRQNVLKTALPMRWLAGAAAQPALYNIVDRILHRLDAGEGATALGGVGLVFPSSCLSWPLRTFTAPAAHRSAPLHAVRGRKDKAEKS